MIRIRTVPSMRRRHGMSHDHAFINMENYGFFLYFREGDKRVSPEEVSDFSVRVQDQSVVYRFFVDLDMISGRDFSLSVV